VRFPIPHSTSKQQAKVQGVNGAGDSSAKGMLRCLLGCVSSTPMPLSSCVQLTTAVNEHEDSPRLSATCHIIHTIPRWSKESCLSLSETQCMYADRAVRSGSQGGTGTWPFVTGN
jgi:hypothetical protein